MISRALVLSSVRRRIGLSPIIRSGISIRRLAYPNTGVQSLPRKLQGSLPTIEELESEFGTRTERKPKQVTR